MGTLSAGSGSEEASLQITCAGASGGPSGLLSSGPSPLAPRPAPGRDLLPLGPRCLACMVSSAQNTDCLPSPRSPAPAASRFPPIGGKVTFPFWVQMPPLKTPLTEPERRPPSLGSLWALADR